MTNWGNTFLKAYIEKQKNDNTNLNWSYKYLPQTPVGSTAMNVNLIKGTFPPNLHNIITPKPWELESWNIERMFTPHHMSYVRCQSVTLQVSGVTIFFLKTKWRG